MKTRVKNILIFLKRHIFSIRFILAFTLVAVVCLAIGLTRIVLTRSYLSMEIDKLETDLESRCGMLAADINRKDYTTNSRNDAINEQIDQLTYTYSGRIIVIAFNHVVIKDTYAEQVGKLIISKEVNKAFRGISTTVYDSTVGNVELSLPIMGSDGKSVKGVLLMTAPDSTIREQVAYIDRTVRMVSDIAFIIALFFAMLFAWIITRPMHNISKSLNGVTSGYMDKRLEEKYGLGELTEMSTEVNKMLDRLKTLDDSRQEFVSNVSHELKTPITSMKVLADSLNGQEDVPVEIYREFMGDIVEEIDRESKIINDLLTLVRMDKTQAELVVNPQSMNELVEHVLKRLKPIAAEKNVELVLESFRPVVAEVDEVKLSLVITNLVENAIKYNVANGWVRVSVNADHKFFYLTVADSGIGIPEESRELIFERFYRVDKARSRQSGGTGLGLAITKNVVLMHKGVIKVYSREGEGSTFTIRIPLKYTK